MPTTGNIAAVQRQLGHREAAYAMQYMRVSEEDLEAVLNDRAGEGQRDTRPDRA
jgi:hypothetical protein